MPTESSLVYLDGALPGDFGFDPLGLFDPQVTSQEERTWLVTSEVIHGAFRLVLFVLSLCCQESKQTLAYMCWVWCLYEMSRAWCSWIARCLVTLSLTCWGCLAFK
jgi:hypothetical protein